MATPSVRKNAELLGKLFAKRFGECTRKLGAAEPGVEKAREYSERYELESGFLRCANARMSLFSRGAPSSASAPEWYA